MRMAQVGVFEYCVETILYPASRHERCSSACALLGSHPDATKSKTSPEAQCDSELLHYSEKHRTLVVELDKAVHELSSLIREMCLLLASQNCE